MYCVDRFAFIIILIISGDAGCTEGEGALKVKEIDFIRILNKLFLFSQIGCEERYEKGDGG